MYGFVTDSPLFDSPGGFSRELTPEEELQYRVSAQKAMEAGRPLTMAEMYGKPQKLFVPLRGYGDAKAAEKAETAKRAKFAGSLIGAIVLFAVLSAVGFSISD